MKLKCLSYGGFQSLDFAGHMCMVLYRSELGSALEELFDVCFPCIGETASLVVVCTSTRRHKHHATSVMLAPGHEFLSCGFLVVFLSTSSSPCGKTI